MLKIKKEHLNKRIGKGSDVYVLSEDLTQKQLMFIKNMVSDAFVEEYDEAKEKAEKEVDAYVNHEPRKKKANKDVEDK